MSFTSTFDLTDFVDRGVEMLLANTVLRNTTVENSLVTGIVAQEPPIEVAPNDTIIPAIYVFPSKNPIRNVEDFGRSTRDAAGAKYYHLEFYNVCIHRGRSKQDAQTKAQSIAAIVRDVYQKNLRMTKPSDTTNPICDINAVVSTPYVLRSETPLIQAINVIVRPDVPIQLT